MDRSIKLTLLPTITLAVLFGFLRTWEAVPEGWSFQSAHIFLFNLTSGGTLLMTFLAGRKGLGSREAAFFLGGLVFSAGALTGLHYLCIVSALGMGVLAESLRWSRFSWFPFDFFSQVEASRKFEQASLLCLSLGLFICAATLINNHYLEWVHFEKLDLHVFYLGFSFPVSLITFGWLFERVEQSGRPPARAASEFAFWSLNLGVIFFFVFIVFEVYPMQFLMALFLFSVVCLAIYLHLSRRSSDQVWALLMSALAFLTLGSLSGIFYVAVLWNFEKYSPGYLLNLHSAANVFGWNLTWILMSVREKDFPLKVKTRTIIIVHWSMVALIPLSRTCWFIGIPATVVCLALLGMVFFSGHVRRTTVPGCG